MNTVEPKISILDHRIIGWYYPFMMKGLVPNSCPLAEKLRTLQKLGYDGMGTSWWELVAFRQEHGDLDQLKRLCQEVRLPLTAYGFVAEGWAFAKGQIQKNANLLAQYAVDLARAAGCQGLYLLGPFDAGDLHQAARAFRELCQYAAQFNMKVALEFVGISQQINGINAAGELIDLAGVENAGIALDSYHFFAGPSTLKHLEAFPLSKIHVVHLADAPADLSDPRFEMDRQMPGHGELPLVEFAQILLNKGFDGFWHVECIQGLDYAADFAEVAQRGLRATQDVLRKAASEPSRQALSTNP
jgi:4-hydroxyphenylpyruvate dioxygenase